MGPPGPGYPSEFGTLFTSEKRVDPVRLGLSSNGLGSLNRNPILIRRRPLREVLQLGI
jgi:hypothetical protein